MEPAEGERVLSGLGTRVRSRFAAVGRDRDLAELRGKPIRPATFPDPIDVPQTLIDGT